MTLINEKYPILLKSCLNNEELINANNFTYSFLNYSFTYVNKVNYLSMSKGSTGGLEVYFYFGLENLDQKCNQLPQSIDYEQYGGVQ